MDDELRNTWDEIPERYKSGETGCRKESYHTKYGLMTITTAIRRNTFQTRYLKLKFRPMNLVTLIKKLLRFETVQEVEIGIKELEKMREFTGFTENIDQTGRNLAFLELKTGREYGISSPIYKAVRDIRSKRTVITSSDIESTWSCSTK